MEMVIRAMERVPGSAYLLTDTTIKTQTYADDLCAVATSTDTIQVMLYKCPNKAMFCGLKRGSNPSLQRPGALEGKHVKDILLDTGCSKTLVRQELVPEGKMLPGKTTTIHCVHGDIVLYPVARLNLEVEGVPVAVEAAVAKNLPTSVLLGTDVPELGRLLGFKPRSRLTLDAQSTNEVAAATKGKEAPERHQVGEIKGNDGSVFNLSDDLFSGGISRVKLLQSQKRAQKRKHQPAAEQLSGHVSRGTEAVGEIGSIPQQPEGHRK
eukprot:Em0007g1306a